MTSILLALQFLTVLPLAIGKVNEKKIAVSMVFFPVIGLILGGLLAGLNTILSIWELPPLALNIILVVTLMAITGGIHLDGLSDMADAFMSGKKKEEMLVIMRDPHIGAMGTLGLISIILLKIGLLLGLNPELKITALILMVVLSRWSAVLLMSLFPYARSEGKAKAYIQGMTPKIALLSAGVTLTLAFAIGRFMGIAAFIIIAGTTYAFGLFCRRKIGGITGDTCGAVIELSEIFVLFIFLFNQRSLL
jgi:adenosylcobinamide-GDP ribazoletransferase